MNVHIWGASGYAAAEAIRFLERHPIEIGAVESRSHAGERIGDHFPLLRTSKQRFDAEGSVIERASPGDVTICAGGPGEATELIAALSAAGVRVIDLSPDFRLDDNAAYGLTEWNRPAIETAALVANPGCYPTATLLAILPLAKLDAPRQWIADAKSGVSGAGRTPSVGSLYVEVADDIRAYGLDGHRHQPEMERAMYAYGISAPLLFTPHVVPLARGMLVDVYAIYENEQEPEAVRDAFEQAYGASPFIRVLNAKQTPSVAAVARSNDVELRVDVRGATVRVLCAIDNLGKGAAGQAVQNLNVMLGFPETTGLEASA